MIFRIDKWEMRFFYIKKKIDYFFIVLLWLTMNDCLYFDYTYLCWKLSVKIVNSVFVAEKFGKK